MVLSMKPYEFVQVDCPNDVMGTVIEMLGSRKGTMESMTNNLNQSRLTYTMPSRGLIGFMTDFMTATKGLWDYKPLISRI